MTSACQKRDREVTPSVHDGDGRPEEWGHVDDVSFPGGDGGQRSDDDDDDEAERLQEGYDETIVNKVPSVSFTSFLTTSSKLGGCC